MLRDARYSDNSSAITRTAAIVRVRHQILCCRRDFGGIADSIECGLRPAPEALRCDLRRDIIANPSVLQQVSHLLGGGFGVVF